MSRQQKIFVPRLMVAAALAACVLSAATARAGNVAATQDGPVIKVTIDGRPLLEYRAEDVTFKPYVAQLYTPAGVPVLRDSPADHKHHHGLMLGLGVNKVDFWSETKDCGRQVGQQIAVNSRSVNDRSTASIVQQLDWLAPGDKLLLQERRTVTASSETDLGATLVTWQSRLECPAGQEAATLWGRHYFGMGERFVVSMDKTGRLIGPDGKPGDVVRGDEHLTAGKWLAYTAAADGKPVTAVVFDDPRNPRHPNRIFSMTKPFAYLSVTLNLEKEPLPVVPGTPVELRLGAAVFDGEATPERIGQLYDRWAKMAAGD